MFRIVNIMKIAFINKIVNNQNKKIIIYNSHIFKNNSISKYILNLLTIFIKIYIKYKLKKISILNFK